MHKNVTFRAICVARPSIEDPERRWAIFGPSGLNLVHRNFFVFQYPGTFPLADSHYGMSELKIPLRTLGLDPDFHAFFTARGDDVRRQIAVQK